MEALTLTVGPYAHTAPLLDPDNPVSVAGHDLRPVRVDPIIAAYRRMVRDLEFDVAELAPTTYVMALAAGLPLTAVPVFLNRRFHHDDLRCSPDSGIRVPADLAGRRVGVRAYSVTTGLWVRGLFAEDFGVDNDKVTWVVDDEDHVPGFVNPPNVEQVTDGSSLGAQLADGRVDAALGGNAGTGRAGKPREGWTATTTEIPAYPLFGAPEVLAYDWYRRTHIYPAHSVIVMRAELARAEPDLPTALYRAFAGAKAGARGDDATSRRLAAQSEVVGGDGLPYGIENNRPTLEALIRFARDQHLLAEPIAVGDLFAAGDYPEA